MSELGERKIGSRYIKRVLVLHVLRGYCRVLMQLTRHLACPCDAGEAHLVSRYVLTFVVGINVSSSFRSSLERHEVGGATLDGSIDRHEWRKDKSRSSSVPRLRKVCLFWSPRLSPRVLSVGKHCSSECHGTALSISNSTYHSVFFKRSRSLSFDACLGQDVQCVCHYNFCACGSMALISGRPTRIHQ